LSLVTFSVAFDISVTYMEPSGNVTGPSGAPMLAAKIPEDMMILPQLPGDVFDEMRLAAFDRLCSLARRIA
jgi:hypothetical protein